VLGYQPESVRARIYLLFDTVLVAFPLLVRVLFVHNSLGSLCFSKQRLFSQISRPVENISF
jgi:hypothetical protein